MTGRLFNLLVWAVQSDLRVICCIMLPLLTLLVLLCAGGTHLGMPLWALTAAAILGTLGIVFGIALFVFAVLPLLLIARRTNASAVA